jgi:trans-aconitate methyltransferase
MACDKWRAYNDLAWTEPLLASPEEYANGVQHFVRVIREHSRIAVRTLLHLGCGAGGHDHTFKKSFEVTGVDISERMLAPARGLNPEVRYIRGDMRYRVRIFACRKPAWGISSCLV